MEMGAFEDLTYWVMYNACEVDLYVEICEILPDKYVVKGTVDDAILDLQVYYSHRGQGRGSQVIILILPSYETPNILDESVPPN